MAAMAMMLGMRTPTRYTCGWEPRLWLSYDMDRDAKIKAIRTYSVKNGIHNQGNTVVQHMLSGCILFADASLQPS